ncbi:MAG: Crp/Fnr family transcriptional regulator [Bacteroidetes bacterium]|nr:Crp/Fnr family transcriptional regulator [Bacteroidota bacterium]
MNRTGVLQSFIEKIYPLDKSTSDQFLSIWQPYDAKRKTVLTRPGDTERYLYFVTEGIQRVYYYDEHDREATIIFSYPPSFFGIADSFLLQTPSRFFAETLTASSFLRTDFQQLDELMKKDHTVERMIRMLTSAAFSGLMERMIEIQCFSSEEKFVALLKRSPHILNMIPHKYIASYLGIDATNFSKLLSKVRI